MNKDRIIQLAIMVRADTGLDNYDGLVRLAEIIEREDNKALKEYQGWLKHQKWLWENTEAGEKYAVSYGAALSRLNQLYGIKP